MTISIFFFGIFSFVFSDYGQYWLYDETFDKIQLSQVRYAGNLLAFVDGLNRRICLYEVGESELRSLGDVSADFPYIIGIDEFSRKISFTEWNSKVSQNVLRVVDFSKKPHKEMVYNVGMYCMGYKLTRYTITFIENDKFLCYGYDHGSRDGPDEKNVDELILFDFGKEEPYNATFDLRKVISDYGDVYYLNFDHHSEEKGRAIAYAKQYGSYGTDRLLKLTFDISQNKWDLLQTAVMDDFSGGSETLVFEFGSRTAIAAIQEEYTKVFLFTKNLELLDVIEYSSVEISRTPVGVKVFRENGRYYLADFSAKPSSPASNEYDTSFYIYEFNSNSSRLVYPELISFVGETQIYADFEDFCWFNAQYDAATLTFHAYSWLAFGSAGAFFDAYRYGSLFNWVWIWIIIGVTCGVLIVCVVLCVIGAMVLCLFKKLKSSSQSTHSYGTHRHGGDSQTVNQYVVNRYVAPDEQSKLLNE